MKTIKLYWSMPIEIDDFFDSEERKDVGIYYITRKHGNKETPLYIGMTSDSFNNRMKSHKYWLKEYRGKIFIRLGRIISPNWYEWDKYQQLIHETESLLIYNMRDILRENTTNTKSVFISEDTIVINYGHSSVIPKRITHYA
ncbi:MAG: hypothetical protein IJO99_03275 [Ruminococcus sp.]|nr:hypothetical protein [Ruminococcus sp.]